MPTDHPAGQDGISRPRVIVSVTATADGRVTLSRVERLLDDGTNLRWKATWERIPYLLAGARRVDLTAALAKIRTQLGAECLVSEAGGGLNGALLRAGLVDELHIITVPALIGGLGTPSIMDGPPLGTGSLPEKLRAIDVQVGSHGSIWAHYEVVAR